MLSSEQRAIVKATVPLLKTGGEALTTHFYNLLLEENPQLRPFFNQAHQANGAQPRALANGVLMYAQHIDQLDQLGSLVSQIINKHVALQILPEHYPVVGECLLRSIRAVLGDAVATPAVLDAWGAAYGQLADILIGAEQQLYEAKAQAPGGWRGARRFRLARREAESLRVVSFYFEPEDGRPVLKAEPGQYIGLRLDIDGQEHRRNYSLSALSTGRGYRISVKHEAGGVVSSFLHEHVQVGDSLELFAPSGDFTLTDSDKPLVLISGGIGITPTLAMLEAALPSGRPVYFIHSARDAQLHAFGPWVDAIVAQHPQVKRFVCYEQGEGGDAVGQLNQTLLAQWLPVDRDVDAYFLGPKGFMTAVNQQLRALGVPDGQRRYEFFGPAAAIQ